MYLKRTAPNWSNSVAFNSALLRRQQRCQWTTSHLFWRGKVLRTIPLSLHLSFVLTPFKHLLMEVFWNTFHHTLPQVINESLYVRKQTRLSLVVYGNHNPIVFCLERWKNTISCDIMKSHRPLHLSYQAKHQSVKRYHLRDTFVIIMLLLGFYCHNATLTGIISGVTYILG